MSLFKKKAPSFPLTDIIRGLQQAVGGAQEMLQVQQMQSVTRFWNSQGDPVVKKIKMGEREMDVPLAVLLPHAQLVMDDVEVKFRTRVGGALPTTQKGLLNAEVATTDIQTQLEGVRVGDDDVMEFTIRFKAKDIPEGMSRVLDEYHKTI